MRRLFIIATVFVVIVGIGVVVYFTFFQSSPAVVVAPQTASSTLPVAGDQTFPQPPSGSTDQSGGTGAPTASPVAVSSRLVKISQGPVVAGEAVVDQPAANASSTPDVLVDFIDRQSGNIFSYSMLTRTLTRISNRTVPGIQSAFWLPNGSLAFVRYLSGTDFSTTNTYALPASGNGGFFLPQDIADIAVASTSVLTLASGVNGSTASVSRIDGTHTAAIFSTPLTSLRVSYAGKSSYLAVTKASASLDGAAFIVDGSGRFSRIAGPLSGLAAIASPSGKWVFVSYTLGAALQTELVNTQTGETLPLPLATIADKCVWASDDSSVYCGIPTATSAAASYPDDWYQGAVSFSDRIWKINVNGRFAQLVDDVSGDANTAIDVSAPAIDKTGTLLVFVNRNDGSLWSYSL